MTKVRPGREALKSIRIDSGGRKVALAVACAALAAAALWTAKWGLANTASVRAETADVAVYLTEMAPDDPQTHYAAAVLLEKNFSPEDLQRSLREFELAAAASPENYHLWLDLGLARGRSGETEAAEKALRRAIELAPNYSRVHWALGNFLVREDRTDEGFELIRRAVAGDQKYTDAAAMTAWQVLEGDVARVRELLGSSPRLNASLALILARENRFDEALQIWSSIHDGDLTGELGDAGKAMLSLLSSANRYRDMARVSTGLSGAWDAGIGRISNGGFEEDLKVKDTGPFEWQIGDGLQPQIAATTGQKHGGDASLVLIFNATDNKDFRPVSQRVAVEPGKTYDFEIFYRSDLKTGVSFKWEITEASTGKVLAQTPAAANRSEWSPLRARFTVPAATDGITVKLVRENCGIVCPVSGNLWFDDAALVSAN